MGHKRSDFLNRAFPFYIFRYMSFFSSCSLSVEYRQFSPYENKSQERFTLCGVDRSVLVVWYGNLAVTKWKGKYERLHAFFILNMEILKTSVCSNNKSKAKCRFICINTLLIIT